MQMTLIPFSSMIRFSSSNEKLTRKVNVNYIVKKEAKLNGKTIITRSTKQKRNGETYERD